MTTTAVTATTTTPAPTVTNPVTLPDTYPSSAVSLGKVFSDGISGYAKAKAVTGASTGTEIEGAVLACIPDLMAVLANPTVIATDFAAAPIGFLTAIALGVLDGIKVLVGKQ